MTVPSRDFLIRQAILNWCVGFAPLTVATEGCAPILDQITAGGRVISGTPWIVEGIRDHFQALLSQYQPMKEAAE